MNRPYPGFERVGLPAAWLLLIPLGCAQSPHERLNAPPQGDTQRRARLQHDFAYMGDNAMLQEMCLYDIHFVPNQANLSGTGEARLERYSELLCDQGGTLNYLPPDDDPDLTKARLDVARKFLADASHGRQKIEVQTGMPRGRTEDAAYAAEARKAGMTVFKPSAPGGAGSTSGKPGGGSGGGGGGDTGTSTSGGGGG